MAAWLFYGRDRKLATKRDHLNAFVMLALDFELRSRARETLRSNPHSADLLKKERKKLDSEPAEEPPVVPLFLHKLPQG